ncbi:MAG TPA: hypothetical protein VG816_01880 [Solirubrobacterales bacterium]|nr:hypothetical protein [Solirubrobacterales bacterium]
MADKARQKALADVRRAQTKFAGVQDKLADARKERRESFEQARETGLTLREIGAAADLHLTRVREIIDSD